MREDRIGTLRLEGEDVTNFVNSFFNPSEEEIADHASRMGRINNSISVRKNNLGFEAEIDGLVLSFLDDETKEESLEVMVRVTVRVTDDLFHSEWEGEMTQAKAGITVSDTFNSCEMDNWLNIAA